MNRWKSGLDFNCLLQTRRVPCHRETLKRKNLESSVGKMKPKFERASRKDKRPVKSLIKALRILDTLGDHPGGLGITDLSGSLKTPKSTVHRLIATMEVAGYVVFEEPTSKYILGSRVARLGEQTNHQSSLLTFGVPALEQLTRVCHEASHLAILEGTEVVYISQEESKEPIRISFVRGHRAPVHCTALGKVFLAELSDSEIMALYKNKKMLDQLTPRTRTKIEDLLPEIGAVRREGIAYDTEEYMPGLCCMAAPVRDFSSRIIAAMSLSMFKHKLTAARKAFLREALVRANGELSEKLGFVVPLKEVAL
jgi:IclR family KDG regulon transcriptional repressor